MLTLTHYRVTIGFISLTDTGTILNRYVILLECDAMYVLNMPTDSAKT